MAAADAGEAQDTAAYAAVEAIYHAYLTGLILALVTRASTASAAEVVFRTFRRQQLARFLPGLQKLGLDRLCRTPSPARSITTCRTRLAA
jgi:hypothetical protein